MSREPFLYCTEGPRVRSNESLHFLLGQMRTVTLVVWVTHVIQYFLEKMETSLRKSYTKLNSAVKRRSP